MSLDADILLWIQNNLRSELLNPLMRLVTQLGDIGLIWILIGLGLMTRKSYRLVGLTVLVALLSEWLLVDGVIKNLVQRTRPFHAIEALEPLIAHPQSFSFPSGHSGSSIAAATVLFMGLPRTWGIAAVILGIAIALSRLYVGVHYPSDVLVGALIGFATGFLSWKLIAQRVHRKNT